MIFHTFKTFHVFLRLMPAESFRLCWFHAIFLLTVFKYVLTFKKTKKPSSFILQNIEKEHGDPQCFPLDATRKVMERDKESC